MFSWLKQWLNPPPPQDPNPTMKYLIAGLGNIGKEYENTRHNIGFKVVEALAKTHQSTWSEERYGALSSFRLKGKTFYLLKPNTFMNLSGKAIHYWLKQENIPQENLLVISDDLNLDFGKIRIKPKGSAGGHNGLTNIEEVLKTQDYARLRVGIGNQFSKGKQVNYVLGEWSADEAASLSLITEHCAKACESFGLEGLSIAMNQYNKTIPL
jgi:PTH1 family peptidyl-tRNA hydrolase